MEQPHDGHGSVHQRSQLWRVRHPLGIHRPPPPPPPPKLLGVVIPHQEQSNWCWVAAGSGIANFYDGVIHPQCEVVTLVFKAIHAPFDTDCCAPGVDRSVQPCNGQSGANQALDHPNHHYDTDVMNPLDTGKINGLIDQGRPFIAGITWTSGEGHFAAVTGYGYAGDPAFESIYVQDPWYGPSWQTPQRFTTAYQGNGSWAFTTLSQP